MPIIPQRSMPNNRYKEMKSVVTRLARSFMISSGYRLSYDDLVQSAYLAAWTAWLSWDQDRARWTTYCWSSVSNAMKDQYSRSIRRILTAEYTDEMPQAACSNINDDAIAVREMHKQLQGIGKQIADCWLDPSPAFVVMMRNKNRSSASAYAVAEYLSMPYDEVRGILKSWRTTL